MKKILLYSTAFLLLLAAGFYYYTFIYSKSHHRNIQAENAIVTTADALSTAFQNNEQAANKQFLNKALEVTGAIVSINKDQSGHINIIIGKVDAFSNVAATLISTASIQQKSGDTITIKGVCTGYLSDVIINEGVIK